MKALCLSEILLLAALGAHAKPVEPGLKTPTMRNREDEVTAFRKVSGFVRVRFYYSADAGAKVGVCMVKPVIPPVVTFKHEDGSTETTPIACPSSLSGAVYVSEGDTVSACFITDTKTCSLVYTITSEEIAAGQIIISYIPALN
ncbi:hypothetical protein CLV59_10255 [Chitinophaga dinghuensis]|uniref:Uncharacterized protein n=1 Tax=Chitinophaga dinghuensis TaxID=1539050 RepID=A0A327W6V9_9BACT|nr:hypothetical protein [Chitinophaga dinghuensis]RAJ85354.1 hypothetical protein CLV59_10255 [Chitinophaga dinghuensis]